MSVARRSVHHLVNLVYRPTSPEGASKDDEFSRRSIEERWLAGYHDTVQALRHPGVLERAAGCLVQTRSPILPSNFNRHPCRRSGHWLALSRSVGSPTFWVCAPSGVMACQSSSA
jgi:hypothetical protein